MSSNIKNCFAGVTSLHRFLTHSLPYLFIIVIPADTGERHRIASVPLPIWKLALENYLINVPFARASSMAGWSSAAASSKTVLTSSLLIKIRSIDDSIIACH